MISFRSRHSFRSAVAALLIVGLLAGCNSGRGGGNSASPTTSATLAAPTTTVAPTTTTVAVPPSPKPSPLAAATALISAWKKHDRVAAATVATDMAVTSLFAVPYTNQTVISRGCSVEFLPRVCSWGPYGGGSGALYEIDVMPVGANWYVSSATVET